MVNSKAAYQEYLSGYPAGQHRTEALEAVDRLERLAPQNIVESINRKIEQLAGGGIDGLERWRHDIARL